MQLTLNGAVVSRDPTPDEVRDAVRDTFENCNEDSFAILERDPEEFVQTAGHLLEYRSGGRHFRSDPNPAEPELIERVFVAYCKGGAGWRALAHWVDVTEEI